MKTSNLPEYCEVMDMPGQWCAHCKKLPDPVVMEDVADDFVPDTSVQLRGNWIKAKYDGNCATCRSEFIKGDYIRSNGRNQWEANCCE